MLRPACLATVLLCASTVTAQIVEPPVVSFTGVVQPAGLDGGDIICAPPTHVLECFEGVFYLQSATIDLDQYLGQNVKLTGQAVDKGCPLYEVFLVEPPPATLAACGTFGLGCQVRLRSGPGGLSQHTLLVSTGPGLFPLSPLKGSLQLAQPFFIVATSPAGHIAPEGYAFDFVMPVDFNLVGIQVYAQSVRRDVGPIGPPQFSNTVCFEIIGIPFTCAEPDC